MRKQAADSLHIHAKNKQIESCLTCKSPDSAPLKEPWAWIPSIVLEVELFRDAVAIPVEGVPPDPDTDVGRHRDLDPGNSAAPWSEIDW